MHHEPRNQTPDQFPLSTKPARFPPAKSPTILSLASKLASCMQHDAKPVPDTGRLWLLLMMAPRRPQGPKAAPRPQGPGDARPDVAIKELAASVPVRPTGSSTDDAHGAPVRPVGSPADRNQCPQKTSLGVIVVFVVVHVLAAGLLGYAPPKSRCSSSIICRQVASPWNRSTQDSGNHLRQQTHTQEVASSTRTRPSLQASPGWWCGTVCLVAAAPPPPPCASEGPSPSPGLVVHCARCTLRPAAGPGNHKKRPEKGARRAGRSRPWWGRAGTRQTKIATTRHRLGPRLAAI